MLPVVANVIKGNFNQSTAFCFRTPVVAEASGDGKKVFEILENTNLSKQDKGIATSPPHTAATENSGFYLQINFFV